MATKVGTNLMLREEHPPFPSLGQRELHWFRVRHTTRRQAAHVGHGMPHGATRRTTHQPGY